MGGGVYSSAAPGDRPTRQGPSAVGPRPPPPTWAHLHAPPQLIGVLLGLLQLILQQPDLLL